MTLPTAPSSVSRILVQFFIFSLSVVQIGLIGRAFTILNDRAEFTEKNLPDGRLHTRPIFASSFLLALITISSWASSVLSSISILFYSQGNSKWSRRLESRAFFTFMDFVAFAMIPINLGVTIVASTKSGHITSSLPPALVDILLQNSGLSLKYRDTDVVLAYTILGWVLFLIFLIGTLLEHHASRKQVGQAPSEMNKEVEAAGGTRS